MTHFGIGLINNNIIVSFKEFYNISADTDTDFFFRRQKDRDKPDTDLLNSVHEHSSVWDTNGRGYTDRQIWSKNIKGESGSKVAKGSFFLFRLLHTAFFLILAAFCTLWQAGRQVGRQAGRQALGRDGTRSADTGAQKTGGRGGGNKEGK